jgi:ribose 5-phosphate isomerase RpiB
MKIKIFSDVKIDKLEETVNQFLAKINIHWNDIGFSTHSTIDGYDVTTVMIRYE